VKHADVCSTQYRPSASGPGRRPGVELRQLDGFQGVIVSLAGGDGPGWTVRHGRRWSAQDQKVKPVGSGLRASCVPGVLHGAGAPGRRTRRISHAAASRSGMWWMTSDSHAPSAEWSGSGRALACPPSTSMPGRRGIWVRMAADGSTARIARSNQSLNAAANAPVPPRCPPRSCPATAADAAGLPHATPRARLAGPRGPPYTPPRSGRRS
jgi:hypothetical protein